MATSILYSDTHVAGTFSADEMIVPSGTVTNAGVVAAAGISATKLEHQYAVYHRQAGNIAAAAEYVHLAYGAGEVVNFRILANTVPSGGDAYTVDLKKNGSSILTAVITMNVSSTANTVYSGTLTGATYVLGDRLEIVVASSSGSSWGAKLVCQAVLREACGV